MTHLRRLSTTVLFFAISLIHAWAQPESQSPYSDQAFDPPVNPNWYETPYLWIGLLLFLGAGIYVMVRGRRA